MIPTTPWEDAYQRLETPAEERRKFIRRLRRLGVQHWSRDAKVIEVCSGRGNGILAWQQLGFSHVIGVDLSPALIDRSACRSRGIVGDARHLPVATASHDVVIVQGGLHHLPSMHDVRLALSEGYDRGLQQVYGCAMPELERRWRAQLGRQGCAPKNAHRNIL